MWVYENFADREQRRGALANDPTWQAHVATMLPLIPRQETRFLTPAPFFQDRFRKQVNPSPA
jgi:hypothetical protein